MLIFEGFLENLKENSNRMAVSDGKRSLTYQELFNTSCQLASTLKSIETKSKYIFILGVKSAESIVAILGTLFSGFTYVALDINHPATRLGYIFSQLSPSVLILTGLNSRLLHELKKMKEIPKHIVDLAGDLPAEIFSDAKRVEMKSALAAPATYSHEQVAYTLFTSGSTGQPKGVCISHRAASAALQMFKRHIGFTNQDVLVNQAALCFDLSVFDIFGALNVGGAVCLIPPEVTALPDRFLQTIAENKATSLYTTPSTLEFLLKNKITTQQNVHLKKIILSGEPTSPELLKKIYDFFLEDVEVWNIYGGTEIPYVISHRLERNSDKETNIFSIKDQEMEIKIRDPFLKDDKNLPIGELLVKGPAVLSGYIYNDTQEISCPLLEEGWYPTGDLASIDINNKIALYGRNDRQVKVSGYRIELDDVEFQLAKCPEIQEAAVIFSKQDQEIQAYLVLKHSRKPKDKSLEAVVNFCEEKLPNIFHPSRLNIIDKMPYTTSGKKDRTALANM